MIRSRARRKVRIESKRCRSSDACDRNRLSTKELLPASRCKELDELNGTVRIGINFVDLPKVEGGKETAGKKREARRKE
jgi:hypothetical protein